MAAWDVVGDTLGYPVGLEGEFVLGKLLFYVQDLLGLFLLDSLLSVPQDLLECLLLGPLSKRGYFHSPMLLPWIMFLLDIDLHVP